MSLPTIVMYLVFAVGLLAASRNPTAAALCMAWLAGEAWWRVTGDNLPTIVYAMTDTLVIVVIFAKATVREGCSTYPTLREQFACCWRALTVCDRFIAGLFVFAAWPIYVSGLHPYYAWYALWAVTIAQFLSAGLEALLDWRRERKARPVDPPSNIILFAPAYARKFIGAEPISTSSDTLFLVVEKAGDG